jgi:hypothetical protein
LHENLPLSVGHMGVCVVCYDGRLDQWQHRLAARKELSITAADPVDHAMAVLEHRHGGRGRGTRTELRELSAMARRGFVAYMERDVMLHECAAWRLGYGAPAPLDLLTGMGCMDLLEMSLDLLAQLLAGQQRWVFVTPRSPIPELESLANALEPLEFAVVTRLHSVLHDRAVENSNYAQSYLKKVLRWIDDVAPQMVLGVYRAGPLSPPRFFVAHEDEVYVAALIAMADAAAVEPQGLPALVRLAQENCRAALGGSAIEKVVRQAYRDAGAEEWFHRGTLS